MKLIYAALCKCKGIVVSVKCNLLCCDIDKESGSILGKIVYFY